MEPLKYDPTQGLARQGDVIIMPLPADLTVDRTAAQIQPRSDGNLVLAQGELTGHHHSILVHMFSPLQFRDDGMTQAAEAKFAAAGNGGVAQLFKSPSLERKLFDCGILTENAEVVGFLTVDDVPVVLRHQEHTAIEIPPGEYYVGRQKSIQRDEIVRVAD
jgi:hypothetical protein